MWNTKNTIWALILLMSCQVKRIDTTQMVEEMKKAEIKRITPEQISSFANEWGGQITNYLNKNKTYSENIDSLNALYHTEISKVDISLIKFDNLDPKEVELIKAYQYNLANKIPLSSNLQKLKGGEIQLFTAPVLYEKNTIWRIPFVKKEIIKKANVSDIKKLVVK